MQPSTAELETALSNLASLQGVRGAQIEARQRLLELRQAKCTWVGKRENDLRFAIDKALS